MAGRFYRLWENTEGTGETLPGSGGRTIFRLWENTEDTGETLPGSGGRTILPSLGGRTLAAKEPTMLPAGL